MNKTSTKPIFLAGLRLLGGMVSRALADEWDQRTILTFGGPVEIPGQVLGAGTYVFKLADSWSDRNVVQVFSKGEQHLYGTFLAIPDHACIPAASRSLRLTRRPAGWPEAVRAWFYPGENTAINLCTRSLRRLHLAKANKTPVASMPAELAVNTREPRCHAERTSRNGHESKLL